MLNHYCIPRLNLTQFMVYNPFNWNVGVRESPAKAWVGGGLLQGWEHWLQQYMHLLREVTIIFITSTTVSVQFSHSVVSDSLQPHESQHARPPCPSPTPGVHSDSHPSSQWCHPAISSSVVPFSSYPQSFPPSRSLPRPKSTILQ